MHSSLLLCAFYLLCMSSTCQSQTLSAVQCLLSMSACMLGGHSSFINLQSWHVTPPKCIEHCPHDKILICIPTANQPIVCVVPAVYRRCICRLPPLHQLSGLSCQPDEKREACQGASPQLVSRPPQGFIRQPLLRALPVQPLPLHQVSHPLNCQGMCQLYRTPRARVRPCRTPLVMCHPCTPLQHL